MNIKIECNCGTRYGFEVEPVNGQMPMPVQCPGCGADGTEAANRLIQQQLALPRPGPVRARLVTPQPAAPLPPPPPATAAPPPPAAASAPPASAAPPPARLTLERASEPAAVPAAAPPPTEPEAPAVEYCSKHPREVAAAYCAVCQKPICNVCLEQFGFLCSVYCQEQAERRKIEVPKYARQKRHVREAERLKTRRVVMALALVAVALLGAWIWYALVGSKPRVALSLKAESGQTFFHARWVGNDRFAAMTGKKLSLYDAANGKELWSAAFKPDEQSAPKPQGLVETAAEMAAQMSVAGEDIWVVFPQRVARFDARTGKREQEIALPQPVAKTVFGETALVVVSAGPANQNVLTRVDLATRQAQTETALLASVKSTPGNLRPASDSEDHEDEPTLRDDVNEFIPAGPSVAHLAVKLLEPRIVTRAAAKAEAAQNRLDAMMDRTNLRAGDSAEATKEFMGSTRDTGGKVDESRYRVTIRRFFGGGLSAWTEDVIGPPALFSLKTVDVFTAGRQLVVFNKSGQKLWEAALTYPVSVRFLEPAEPPAAPGFEAGNRLYFFDQGMLTAFELKTGQVQWRVTSVGISQAQLGRGGKLYLASSTALPEYIPTSREIRFNQWVHPLILQVDASSGKVSWQSDRLGERVHVTGKFVYAASAQVSMWDQIAAGPSDTKVPVHHRVFRLDPGTGKELWEYYEPRAPIYLEARQNRLLLLYPDEVQVLKFVAL